MNFSPRLAFESLEAQDAHMLQAVQKLMPYLLERSPFYRRRFSLYRAGLEDIRNIRDMQRLPFTTKADVQEFNWDFLCVPRHQVREYTATSGTMGRPVTIALTANDLKRLAYNEAQSFRRTGGTPQDIYQLALTLDRQFMAGMAYYSGIQEMGATSVRTGPGLPQMQWDTIERLQSTCLVGVPSFLLQMAGYAAEYGISLNESPVKKAICIGESIRRADFSPSTLGEQIAAAWPIQLFSTYAATELQTAFTECPAGRGGHHQPDLVVVEIVDEDGLPVPDGTPGEVVVTTLGIEAMPLLRYRTGDVATLHAAPCSCGRLSKRLGPVIGRKGQMIKYKGTTLYPPAVFDILNEAAYISAYVVEVFTGDSGTDELRLHLHTDLPLDYCDKKLRTLLQARLRVTPQLRYHKSAAALQAMQTPPGSRKTVRFIDNRVVRD